MPKGFKFNPETRTDVLDYQAVIDDLEEKKAIIEDLIEKIRILSAALPITVQGSDEAAQRAADSRKAQTS